MSDGVVHLSSSPLSLLLTRRREVSGVFGVNAARSKDGVWRSHPGSSLPPTRQEEEEEVHIVVKATHRNSLLTPVSSQTVLSDQTRELRKNLTELSRSEELSVTSGCLMSVKFFQVNRNEVTLPQPLRVEYNNFLKITFVAHDSDGVSIKLARHYSPQTGNSHWCEEPVLVILLFTCWRLFTGVTWLTNLNPTFKNDFKLATLG